jgi:chromosome partitioning protein
MKTVSLVNMKGGVAKTTLAVNLAHSLATRHDKKVLLIDIDPQFNATQCLLSGEKYKELLEGGCSTITDIFDTSRITVSTVLGVGKKNAAQLNSIKPLEIAKGYSFLPGNLQLYRLEMSPGDGRENRIRRYLETVNGAYDVVLIDTPPTPSVWMSAALIASDYYLIPVKPEPLSSTGIDLLQAVVNQKKENYGLNLECAGVVFTMTERQTLVYQSAIAFIDSNKLWKKHRYVHDLPKRTKIAAMAGNQEFILDSGDPESKKSLSGITTEFLASIGL